MGSRKKRGFNWVALSAFAGAGTAAIAALAWLAPPTSSDGDTYVSNVSDNEIMDRGESQDPVGASSRAAAAYKQTDTSPHRRKSVPVSPNTAPTAAPPRARGATDAAQAKDTRADGRNVQIGSVVSHNQSGGYTVGYLENANSGEPQ